MPAPLVSFVIPVRNDATGLARCLTSVRAQRGVGEFEIIVVDNGSIDGSDEVARSFGATVLTIPGRGVGELRNRGAAAARGTFVAFVDADVELGPDWLRTALLYMADPQVAMAGAEYAPAPDANWVQRLYDGLRHPSGPPADTRWLPAGNVLVRRAAFEAIGGFDESLQTCEDWDLCLRLHERGGRLLAAGDLRSVHYGDPASLGALFRGEAWRGRDNLRVSLRRIPALRDLPGILIPIVWLAGALMAAAGVVAAVVAGPSALSATAAGMAMMAGLSLLRAVAIRRRTRQVPGSSAARAWLLAVVFDAARAFALVYSMPHRRATVPEPQPSPSGAAR